ncbi:MAG: response regulator [Thermodesulfobacteriota bacterium]
MKVLIVEDDSISRMYLEEILRDFGDTHSAEDGVEALEIFKEALDESAPFNLICLDIMMPKLNGHQTLQQVREIEHRRGIGAGEMVPVLMTTALSDDNNVMEAFMKGTCDGYLVKPIGREKLVAELKRLSLV